MKYNIKTYENFDDDSYHQQIQENELNSSYTKAIYSKLTELDATIDEFNENFVFDKDDDMDYDKSKVYNKINNFQVLLHELQENIEYFNSI